MADDERLFLNLDSGFNVPESNLGNIQPTLNLQQNHDEVQSVRSNLNLLQSLQQPNLNVQQTHLNTLHNAQQSNLNMQNNQHNLNMSNNLQTNLNSQHNLNLSGNNTQNLNLTNNLQSNLNSLQVNYNSQSANQHNLNINSQPINPHNLNLNSQPVNQHNLNVNSQPAVHNLNSQVNQHNLNVNMQQPNHNLQQGNINVQQNLDIRTNLNSPNLNNLQQLENPQSEQSNINLQDGMQDHLADLHDVLEEEDVKPNIEDLDLILSSKSSSNSNSSSSAGDNNKRHNVNHAGTSGSENKQQHGNNDGKHRHEQSLSSNQRNVSPSGNQQNLNVSASEKQQNSMSSNLSTTSNDISLGDLNESLQQQAGAKGRNPNSSSEEMAIESPSTVQEEGYYVFKCVFCEAILGGKDQEPKILECLHNACGGCVRQKLFEQSNDGANVAAGGQNPRGFECTACGYFSNAGNILDNRFLIESAQNSDDPSNKSEELKCSSCSDDALATSWCVECSEYICDTCVRAHQRLKITKDHTIKPKEEESQQPFNANNGQTSLFCNIHPNEKLSLFCEFCDKLTCRDCQLTEHRDHKYKFTHEIASDCRKSIHAMLTDISYKKVLLTSAMKVIDDRQTLITDKKQALVEEITNLVVRLTSTINVRGKQLVARLNEVCNTKQKTLDEKKVALDHLSKITDHCIQFTKNVLENGSDSALLYSKKHVTSHIQRIKSRRADIPNPEIPVRIHLALDKVPDLIKVISSIGQIVVDGRVYPSQTPSPLPPQNSPSPSQLAQAPQQQQQQQQQQQLPQQPQPQPQPLPPSYPQQTRMAAPPAYVQQQYSPNLRQMGPVSRPGMMSQQQQQHLMGNMQMAQNQAQNINQIAAQTMAGNMHNAMPPMQRISVRSSLRPLMPHTRFHGAGMNSQQQVTSSTHPQALHDRSNLRHLLQHTNNNAPNINNAVYVQTGPNQYQAVQAQLAHQYNAPRFQNPPPPFHRQQQQQMQRLNIPIRQQLQQPQQNFQQQVVARPTQVNSKWHIPQQQQQHQQGEGTSNHPTANPSTKMPTLNTNFKIMLKPQGAPQQGQQNQHELNKNPVTSTIPKTPSPNHLLNTEKSLDKFCEESVNDLMATIAKLDSNGVQVLAERGNNGGVKSGSPHVVDSSTGDGGLDSSSEKINFNKTTEKMGIITGDVGLMEMGKDDPNEDWCAVCMDGGELVCCDRCPKVFHQFCHIPNLSVEESDTWQCLLCMNFADVPDSGDPLEPELSPRQRKVAERLVLELYCQYDPSLPFREVIGPENEAYHEIIKNPIALDTIRHKLDWNAPNHYTSLEQLVRDVRLMFKNCYTFNPVNSPVYNDAKTLEKFFDEQLEKWLPEYAYETFEEDENLQPPNKKFKRIITDQML